jgi:hypothetical protein
MLASLLFPYDDDAPALIGGWLGELEREGCITPYTIDSQHYIQINNWLHHQKIDKPSPSHFPALASPRESSPNPRESSSEDQGPRTKEGIKEVELGFEPCAVLGDWYKKHQAKTARLVAPSDPDRLAAKDLGNRYPPEELSAAVAEYWGNWPDYWFAVKNGDMKKPREDRKPMYLFASFAKNIEELLQNKPALAESREAPRPVESIICPVCGTNETPDTRMRCRKCGFYLDPSWINDPELIAEYAESKQKEGEDA